MICGAEVAAAAVVRAAKGLFKELDADGAPTLSLSHCCSHCLFLALCLTISLSPVLLLVVVMKPKELKTKISHANPLTLFLYHTLWILWQP